jgi:hypothetical protein
VRRLNDCGLNLRLVLHAQQFDAVQIDLGNVAGPEAVAADLDDVVVVLEICLGQIEHGLGFKGAHECRAQRELHIALQVFVLGLRDARALLGALQAQFALVVALVKIAEAGRKEGAAERFPDAMIGRNLGSVRGGRELRVGTQIGRDFLGLHLVHVVGIGLESWVGGLKPRLDLVPGEAWLRADKRRRQKQQSSHCQD